VLFPVVGRITGLRIFLDLLGRALRGPLIELRGTLQLPKRRFFSSLPRPFASLGLSSQRYPEASGRVLLPSFARTCRYSNCASGARKEKFRRCAQNSAARRCPLSCPSGTLSLRAPSRTTRKKRTPASFWRPSVRNEASKRRNGYSSTLPIPGFFLRPDLSSRLEEVDFPYPSEACFTQRYNPSLTQVV
jgi:hypothetical protein